MATIGGERGTAMTMTERWAKCEQLAVILGMKKSEVFNCLSEIQDRGLVERVEARDEEAIKIVQNLPRYGYQPKQKYEPPKTAFEAIANDIQLMLWTVKKIGDPGRARTAFENVMKALGH